VRFELLDGRVPLGLQSLAGQPSMRTLPKKPSNLGGLIDKIDPSTAVGHCYMTYVRYFSEQSARDAGNVANTRPTGASRSGK